MMFGLRENRRVKKGLFVMILLFAAMFFLLGTGDFFGGANGYARETISLDGTWQFATDPDDLGESQAWFCPDAAWPLMPRDGYAPGADGTIRVPGIWDAQGYGVETDKVWHNYIGVGWYRRSFEVPASWESSEGILTLGGISRYAKVWVNGVSAGDESIGPVASHEFDLTPLLKYGAVNDITIRVDSEQRWDIDAIQGASSIIDYMDIPWGGLWGHVTLESRPKCRIADLYLVTDLDSSTIGANVNFNRFPAGETLRLEIFDAEGGCVATETENLSLPSDEESRQQEPLGLICPTNISAKIESPKLWSPDSPSLYTVRVTLLSDRNELDSVESHYGMRVFRAEGHRLFLNDSPLFLRGYGDDHIYPYEFSMPTNKEMYRQRLALIKSFGFNHVRHHSTILPEEYYQACDELGMITTAEFPIGYPHQLPGKDWWKAKVPEGTDPAAALAVYVERFTQVVRENRNHPSILTWVMGNELWEGMSINHEFATIARRLDPHRFFCDSDGDWRNFIVENDRDTLDLYFVLFNEWISPIVNDKFALPAMKKPVISHEAGNFITFSRPDQIALFDDGNFDGNPSLAGRNTENALPLKSNYKPFWMTEGAEKLRALGLDSEADEWAKASEAMYFVHHKYNVETMRLTPKIAGYHWWLFQDYWTTSNGLVDLFFRPKSIPPERVRQFNNDLVLLQKGLQLTYTGGEPLAVTLWGSNFSDRTPRGEVRIGYSLETSEGVQSSVYGGNVQIPKPGEVAPLLLWRDTLPNVEKPTRMTVTSELRDRNETLIQQNEWFAWVYPQEQRVNTEGKTVYASDTVRELFSDTGWRPIPDTESLDPQSVYVVDLLDARVTDALNAGAGVVLLSDRETFPCQAIQYQQTWWKGGDSDAANHVGTYVYPTELMRGIETENWCEPHWVHLLDGAVKYPLESFSTRPTVHLRALPSLVRVQDTAVIFEVGIGDGRLIVSGLNHFGAVEEPAGDSTERVEFFDTPEPSDSSNLSDSPEFSNNPNLSNSPELVDSPEKVSDAKAHSTKKPRPENIAAVFAMVEQACFSSPNF